MLLMHPLKKLPKEDLTQIAHGRRQNRRDGAAGGGHYPLRKYE